MTNNRLSPNGEPLDLEQSELQRVIGREFPELEELLRETRGAIALDELLGMPDEENGTHAFR